ncbi:exonuclease V-like isoform X3 [Rhizophagus clarus]|uniref:Exonuclease V-like isoform X3 n=1 Tax=Rhizophagus clarus TaxID=94130 RepID=A0A8H3QVT9_9GLOM|nr:exonuclease V-like isoform X3 [Rhizophagus clarus]
MYNFLHKYKLKRVELQINSNVPSDTITQNENSPIERFRGRKITLAIKTDLKTDLEFSNELSNIIKISYKGKEIKEFNLQNLMKFVINRFWKVWKTCNVLEVNYKFQEDGSDLGYRIPEGVPIEDAWKCQNCDFAENCEWRLNKIKEHAQRRRDL